MLENLHTDEKKTVGEINLILKKNNDSFMEGTSKQGVSLKLYDKMKQILRIRKRQVKQGQGVT